MTADLLPATTPRRNPIRRWFGPGTANGRRHILGVVVIVVLFALATNITTWSRFDGVRDDIAADTRDAAVTGGAPIEQISECFQGFCFEENTNRTDAWREFVASYSSLVAVGIALALIFGGLATGFFGAPLSASTRLALPPIAALLLILFSIEIAVVALAGLGWIVWTRRTEREDPIETGEGWRDLADTAGTLAARTTWYVAVRVLPILVAVVLVGAAAIQNLDAATVSSLAGNHLVGVFVGTIVGMLVPLPWLAAVPAAAGLLLIGVGPGPITAFLVAAIVGGPLVPAGWGGQGRIRRSHAITLAVAVVAGGMTVGWGTAVASANAQPVVTFDGTACTYEGPSTLPVSATEFRVVNDSTFLGTGISMGVMLGRLPDDVTIDQFEADVAALPAGALPGYFSTAGEENFVFPGSQRPTTFVVHNPGTYALVCTNGGGGYVVREFSMIQPQGWFDEFRETYEQFIVPTTLNFSD